MAGVKKYLSLVKFAHTLFALPFALTGYALASSLAGNPDWKVLLLVVVCMVTARNTAMAFNRFIDRDIDAKNARTKTREIPAGAIAPKAALVFIILNAAGFITATWFINFPCFILSPVALAVIMGYSLTKRFTALCHLVLGLGLSLAPVGAYLAVTGEFAAAPVLLGCTVLTWVAGFDIIYALQDEEFDKSQKLHSIPALTGKKSALIISSVLHTFTVATLVAFGLLAGGQWIFWTGAGIFCILLAYQHFLVKPNDLSRVNLAFFTLNGIASVAFSAFAIFDFFWFKA